MKQQIIRTSLTKEWKIEGCKFNDETYLDRLPYRDAPFWHVLSTSRHIGVYKPNDRICTWTARYLNKEKKYKQQRIGRALNSGTEQAIPFDEAVRRSLEWFKSPEIKNVSNETKPVGKVDRICCTPIGDVYTVGHALRDYTEWTRISRSPGGHYNNLVLINYHIVPDFAQIPLDQFTAKHLVQLAQQVIQRPPRSGFEPPSNKRCKLEDLRPDELRRRKRTFNSLVSILRMAFRHAWENGYLDSERPWRCLRRIAVIHSPRTIFLDRDECRQLLEACTPALRKLVQAALYTGCRVGELGALRVEDVGYQVYGIRIAAFKRSPSRFVFLPDEGMSFFLSSCEGKSPRDFVFLSDMGKPWKKQHSRLFRRAVSIAGLPSNFVFHGLRHTYASDLVRQGVQLDLVAKQLGHANTITVSNTYGHLAEHYREDQIRKKFSPLDIHQAKQARARSIELEKLLDSFRGSEWREYGRVEPTHAAALKSYVTTQADVLRAFGEG